LRVVDLQRWDQTLFSPTLVSQRSITGPCSIVILDEIEFNERFRHNYVAATTRVISPV
jgi:hypothetical protein